MFDTHFPRNRPPIRREKTIFGRVHPTRTVTDAGIIISRKPTNSITPLAINTRPRIIVTDTELILQRHSILPTLRVRILVIKTIKPVIRSALQLQLQQIHFKRRPQINRWWEWQERWSPNRWVEGGGGEIGWGIKMNF